MYCVSHRTVPAVFRCDRCGGCVCRTCVFELPGARHLCPSCAVEGAKTFGPARRNTMFGAMALGAVATVSTALLMFGAFARLASDPSSVMLLGFLLIGIALLPALAGLSLAWGAIEKRLHNPVPLWITLYWNAAIAALFVLLSIIGNFSK